eukprot:1556177-Alexandrium_andersonii.AAC.1
MRNHVRESVKAWLQDESEVWTKQIVPDPVAGPGVDEGDDGVADVLGVCWRDGAGASRTVDVAV